MLKRDDLVKQFELVVKQEIKNHNDQILATNLSINDLKENLSNQATNHEKEIASLKNENQLKNIEIGILRKVYSDLNQKLESFMNDSKELNFQYRSQFDKTEKNIKYLESLLEELRKYLQQIAVACSTNSVLVNDLSTTIETKFDDNIFKTRKDIENLKIEILSIPSEAQKIKKELQEQMEINKVDFSGLMKEVNLCKKNTMIIEKNIENLYTQIDRLKVGK